MVVMLPQVGQSLVLSLLGEGLYFFVLHKPVWGVCY